MFLFQTFKALSIGLVSCSLAFSIKVQIAKADQRVLVIHSYHDELSWVKGVRGGINQGLQEDSEDVEIFHEFLNAKQHPNLPHGEAFLQQLRLKYQEQPLDLIIVSDDPGLRLLLEHREQYFDNLPIVFLGINKVEPEILSVPNMTGVFEKHSTTETALGALEQTKADHLIVLNDSTETGQANLGGIDELRRHPQAPQEIIILNDITPENVESVFEKYPRHWPVLVLGQLRQDSAEGSLLGFSETAQTLRRKLPNPLYAEASLFLGHGVVGGKILDSEHHAYQAVDLAQQILGGEAADQIEPIVNAKNLWFFDFRELQRFRFKTGSLPEGSQIINELPPFYQRYEHLVWLTFGSFLIALLIILLLVEIIRRRVAEEKILRDNEQRYKDLSEAGASIFWELDSDLRFTYISGDTQALNGQKATQLLGQSLYEIVESDARFDFDWKAFLKAVQTKQSIQDFIFRTQQSGNAIRIFKLNGKPIRDRANVFRGHRGIIREITKEYHLAETLAYQATYDSLTGLLNRCEFDNRLQRTIQHCYHSAHQAVLCYLDLDQFKVVNDTAGHLIGDQLLIEISQIIHSSIRTSDVLGRLGGDEFGLILEDCPLEDAKVICESLVETIQAYRFQWQDRQFNVGCSIGIAPIPGDSMNAVELLSQADLACYKAKDSGRGRIYVATPDNPDLSSDRTQMAYIANISQAIEEDRFYLVQQKIQALSKSSHSSEHFEVLIRFRDSTNQIVSPGKLIPAAERYGVIGILDRWVLETVLDRVLKQKTATGKNVLISINLSGVSLSDERFLKHAKELVFQAGMLASCLCFEITETAAISHWSEATQFIHQMRGLGVKFALDDFGSGLSSFGYLRKLPVDFLKIDGSLIKNILQEPHNLAIVQLINHIAHMMDMQTIAEFVEDEATLTCLRNIGIDHAQGYGIAKPKLLQLATPHLVV